jgi:hypothetical protein
MADNSDSSLWANFARSWKPAAPLHGVNDAEDLLDDGSCVVRGLEVEKELLGVSQQLFRLFEETSSEFCVEICHVRSPLLLAHQAPASSVEVQGT